MGILWSVAVFHHAWNVLGTESVPFQHTELIVVFTHKIQGDAECISIRSGQCTYVQCLVLVLIDIDLLTAVRSNIILN